MLSCVQCLAIVLSCTCAVSCELDDRDARLMEDVSAKVDLVFDRLTAPEEDYDNFIGE